MTPGLPGADARAATTPSAGRSGSSLNRLLASPTAGYGLLALLCYLPPLLTAPGKVAADTKTYLYLDPGRLMARALSMWDPHIGMGTVTHQNIGYLFPLGPFYWVFEQVGLPDWAAQRLWLGSLLLGAGTGVLYLCRTLGLRGPGVVVAALAYTFSPYSLHYAARISVILLPWAGLGWMIGLTIKALRDGGWRYPALFAIVVQVVGGVNATALIFAGVGPVLWVLYTLLITREDPWRRTVATTLRIAVLTVLCSSWWMAGLSLQGGYGLNILKYTETVRAVARTSLPNEVLRGLGYWFFYGQDRLGPWIEAAGNYTQRPLIILIGYGLAVLALLSAASIRWRHRAYFVLLTLVGVVVAVGAHPYDSPTPLGALFKAFAGSSTAGLALRSTGRAIPLVTLGLAMLLGRGVDAVGDVLRRNGRPRPAMGVAALVGVLVLANFPALYDGTFYGKNLQRPEEIPDYWREATAYVDARPHDTRVMELPGSDFASYRWGNTVDPITPGLVDRPYVARELIPYGTPPSADLLNAFDRRLQELVFDQDGFADLLRRMSVGDVLLRYDIQHERYNLIRPRLLQRAFTPSPDGLAGPTTFGEQIAGVPLLNFVDELDLAAPADEPENPPLADYSVSDPLPIVRAESTERPLIVAGDGEGLVDTADVGLLAGSGVVFYSGWYGSDADALRDALTDDAVLVVTDSNRRRGRRWSTVRDNTGYTEQAGEDPYVEVTGDARLEVFPDAGENAYTVTEQRGVDNIVASAYGNPIAFTPEDRAAHALDGDTHTAWRTSAFDEAIGQKLKIVFDEAVTTGRVNLVQPLYGPKERYITDVTLRFEGADEQHVILGAASRTKGGQTIFFDTRTFRSLEIEVADVNVGRRLLHRGASAVGFAEIRIRSDEARRDVGVDEVVVMPRDLLDGVGEASDGHALVLLMNRQRGVPVPPRSDEEARVARAFTLPTERTFALTGDARLTTIAELADLDSALGLRDAAAGGVTEDVSEWLAGCIRCRPLAAIDGNPATAWNTPFENVRRQWVEYTLPEPITFDHLDLQVVADGRHSVPTRVRLQVDNATREFILEPLDDRVDAGENATRSTRLEFPAMSGRRITVTLVDVREVATRNFFHSEDVLLPAAIAELGIPGLEAPAGSEQLRQGCRDDLLTIDDDPLPVRLTGSRDDAESLRALDVELCDRDDPSATPTLELAAGEHVLRSAPGSETAVDFDRLVLASAADGGPLAVGAGRVTGLPGEAPAAPRAEVVEERATRLTVRVDDVQGPFWLVLGQSQSPGWVARVSGGSSLGRSELVDGYANGWLVDPDGRGSVELTLEWTPQRRVWVALGLSGGGLLLCFGIVFVTWRRRRFAPAASPAEAAVELVGPAQPLGERTPRWALWVGPLVGGCAGGLIVAPWAGVLVALLVFAALRWPVSRALSALAAPVLLGLAAVYIAFKQLRYQFPSIFEWPILFPRARTLGWLAIVLLAADALVELLRTRRGEDAREGSPGRAGPTDR